MLDKSNITKLRSFDSYISKLKTYIIEEGGTFNERVFPTIDEAYNSSKAGKHLLIDKYYNSSINNIDDLFNVISSEDNNFDDYVAQDHPEAVDFLNGMKASYGRMLARNDMALTVKWARDYDPVSKLVKLLDICFKADNAVWDSSNETLLWLEHNLNYAKKISFSSQYYPKVLLEAAKGYERTEILEYTDDELKVMARAIVSMQRLLEPVKGKLKRMPIEQTSMEAHEKNNKAAESFIGYGNQKNDKVKERVIAHAHYLNDNASIDNCCTIYTTQHRIQPDGNKLVEAAGIHINHDSGKIVYDIQMLFTAMQKLAAERGYITYFSTDKVESISEVAAYVTIEELPNSSDARDEIITSNPGCDYIKNTDRETGEWLYKYAITIPAVFNLIEDKYPTVTDEAKSIGVKTRVVFAAESDVSRLAQTFLYPYMNALRELTLPSDVNYSSMAQWSHPDHLRQMFTDMAFVTNPHLYDGYKLTTRNNQKSVTELHDKLVEEGYEFIQTSDDKSGFDNMNSPLFQFATASCLFAYAFDLSADDERILKFIMAGSMFPVVFGPNGITLYSLIVPSGMTFTSIHGTNSSNIASRMLRYMMAGCLDVDQHNSYQFTDNETAQENEGGFKIQNGYLKPRTESEDTISEKGDNDDDEEQI